MESRVCFFYLSRNLKVEVERRTAGKDLFPFYFFQNLEV